ncbi:PilR protein [Escherichia coli]|uniref:PilR protein n=1 Tax=Escherichia coli TaxID=562 RepID=A0A377HGP9_ECOLX|nr:PilR protein [Escherichia coli]
MPGQTLDENGIPLLNWPQTALSLFVKTVGENSLEYTLSLWVPQEEAAVISAGIRSGSIVDALQFATTLTDAKEQIHQAIWQMAIYPVDC